MPLFRGPLNVHLGFDEKTNQPEVSSEYDSTDRAYLVRVSDALKAKWREALEGHGFSEVADPNAPEPKADNSKE